MHLNLSHSYHCRFLSLLLKPPHPFLAVFFNLLQFPLPLLLKDSSFMFILMHHLILSFQPTDLSNCGNLSVRSSRAAHYVRVLQNGTFCCFQAGFLSDNNAIFLHNICEKFYLEFSESTNHLQPLHLNSTY
jgi:hypothetical protein